MTAKDTVRALLDRLPVDCTLDDVQYHLYVVQAVARGEADEKAGRTIPHEQVDAELRRKWLLGRAGQSGPSRRARRSTRLSPYISQESPDAAVRVLTRALDTAASLSTLAERGRLVREVSNASRRRSFELRRAISGCTCRRPRCERVNPRPREWSPQVSRIPLGAVPHAEHILLRVGSEVR